VKQVLVPDEKGRSFARAVRVGQFLFMSGMTGQWDLATWERDSRSLGDVEYQTRRIFEWAQKVLGECGLGMGDVVKTTTFIRSMQDLPAIGRVKQEFFPDNDVTDSTIAAADFVGSADLEIEFLAVYPDGR